MKLILGTVQLGIDYGISKKKPTLEQSLEILNYCINNNINTFDTAQDYGNCEEIISNISNKNINIITKINFYSKKYNNISYDDILNKINLSLKNLKIIYLNTLLLHRYDDFLNKKLINDLFKIKKLGLIKKIGVSVYSVEEAIEVLKDLRFKVIQIPFNYLDNQWNNQEFHSLIQKRNDIEIHVRSIFLQGILINEFKYWPKINNYNFEPIYNNINNICKKYKLSKIEFVIGYIKSIKWIDSVIFGVDNIIQLKENIQLYKNTKEIDKNIINECTEIFSNTPKELVNPVLWK
jgi:aryl-alcohol dehydrogenase-like predicted oxidoreductase